jgi:hypothetical protein
MILVEVFTGYYKIRTQDRELLGYLEKPYAESPAWVFTPSAISNEPLSFNERELNAMASALRVLNAGGELEDGKYGVA